MSTAWEPELAGLLNELLTVQGRLLNLLDRKRQFLLVADAAGLATLAPEEERLVEDLQQCVRRRADLLAQAGRDGLPNASIQVLTRSLPPTQRGRLGAAVREAASRVQLLRHQSLASWVVVQRTLLHLSQLLEIIATGGRLQPTYGEEGPVQATGALVDRAA